MIINCYYITDVSNLVKPGTVNGKIEIIITDLIDDNVDDFLCDHL